MVDGNEFTDNAHNVYYHSAFINGILDSHIIFTPILSPLIGLLGSSAKYSRVPYPVSNQLLVK